MDEALWIATTAPVSNLKADEGFLALLDSDQDGRLRAEEIKDGIRFLLANLTDYSGIRAKAANLPLDAINKDTRPWQPHSRLGHQGPQDASSPTVDRIDLEQVRTVKRGSTSGRSR